MTTALILNVKLNPAQARAVGELANAGQVTREAIVRKLIEEAAIRADLKIDFQPEAVTIPRRAPVEGGAE